MGRLIKSFINFHFQNISNDYLNLQILLTARLTLIEIQNLKNLNWKKYSPTFRTSVFVNSNVCPKILRLSTPTVVPLLHLSHSDVWYSWVCPLWILMFFHSYVWRGTHRICPFNIRRKLSIMRCNTNVDIFMWPDEGREWGDIGQFITLVPKVL